MAAALLAAFPRLGRTQAATLRRLNREMKRAVEKGDFDRYYERNLAFHDVFLDRCDNERLVRLVRTLKQWLYDWPRRRGFVKAWERASVGEHAAFARLVSKGEARAAADHLRDALIQLEAEGIVTILPRRGVQVRELTRDDVRLTSTRWSAPSRAPPSSPSSRAWAPARSRR